MKSNKLKKKRILFLGTQMAVGGSQHVLKTLASYFHQHGYHVVTAFLYDRDGLSLQWRVENSYPVINLGAKKGKSERINVFDILSSVFRLYSLMIREHFDVVITFTHHSNLVGIPLAWLAGVPVRIATHRGRIAAFPRIFERLHSMMVNIKIPSCLVANSQQVRHQAIQLEGVKPERVLVIPNGISGQYRLSEEGTLDNHARVEAVRSQMRENLGVSMNSALVLSVGRLTNQKGQIHLINAWPGVLRRCPDARLFFAGDGDMRQGLEMRTEELGIIDSISFLGTRGDIPALLTAADLFVLPSISEGMPNALLEAMGMGIPVIASSLECVEEIVTHGVSGFLVHPGDVQALGDSLVYLIQNPELRIRLSQNGRRLVEEKYTVEKMCESYERIFAKFNPE